LKLAEAAAIFLERQGVEHIFGVNGGANLHLIHGIYDKTKIKFICTATETGAGYAADAYARIRGLGVAMATSGPGATNLVTAISAAWQDSTPVLFITGNVATFRRGTPLGVRSYGFQELEFCDMIRGVTKFAIQANHPDLVLPLLRQAIMHAQGDQKLFGCTPRKGPVVVDIPDDVQRMDIEEWKLPWR
jgi:acetolactate synthase-1/2/3 large subunit